MIEWYWLAVAVVVTLVVVLGFWIGSAQRHRWSEHSYSQTYPDAKSLHPNVSSVSGSAAEVYATGTQPSGVSFTEDIRGLAKPAVKGKVGRQANWPGNRTFKHRFTRRVGR